MCDLMRSVSGNYHPVNFPVVKNEGSSAHRILAWGLSIGRAPSISLQAFRTKGAEGTAIGP